MPILNIKKKSLRIFFYAISLLLFGLVSQEIYWYVEEIMNEDRKAQVPLKMEQNLLENKAEFEKITTFLMKFKNLSYIDWREDESIFFIIQDSLVNINEIISDSLNRIDFSENGYSEINGALYLEEKIINVDFLDNDSIKVFTKRGTSFLLKNWTIVFEGKGNSPLIQKLFSYSNNSIDQLDLLKNNLDEIHCFEISKNEEFISLPFAGTHFRNFNYKIPIVSNLKKKDWNLIEKGYYRHFYDSHISCNMYIEW
jgi:hypothetical protein